MGRHAGGSRVLLGGWLAGVAAACLACRGIGAADPAADSPEFPAELVEFSPHEQNPVFRPAGKGWEVRIRERGWIVREKDKYRMWYTGYDGTRDGIKSLGYAESTDGIRWRRPYDQPIYDDHWVEDMMVVREGNTYYMFAEGRDDQAHWLTSPDGIEWTRQGLVDIRHADGRRISAGPYGTPFAWKEDETWRLLFERQDAGVWLATSSDLKTWTLVQEEPVLSPGPEAHDAELIAVNQVVRHDGRYYAYYHGSGKTPNGPRTWNTNVAVSTDGLHWEKYSGNPIVQGKSSGILTQDGEGFRLYTMHDQVDLHVSQPAAD